MPRNNRRSRRRNPPRWFMPAVMAGLGAAAALLSAAMLIAIE
ncbi:MAG: hypothetical protein PSY12_03380 [bacterium]|nr:hypothetical protein [bacterium]